MIDLLKRLKELQGGMSRPDAPDLPPVAPPAQPVFQDRMPEPRIDPRVEVIQRLQAEAQQDMTPKVNPDEATGKKILFAVMRGLQASQNKGGYAGMRQQEFENDQVRKNGLLNQIKGLQSGVDTDREFQFNQDRENRIAQDNDAQRGINEQAQRRLEDQAVGTQFQNADQLAETKRHNLATESKSTQVDLTNLSKDTVLYKGEATDVLTDLDPASPTKGKVFLPTANGLIDITGQTKHFETPAKYGEPLQTIYDPERGVNTLVPRSSVPRDNVAAQPAGVLKESRETESAAYKISKLESAYKDDFVGPAAGRILKLKTALPSFGGLNELPEGYGTFIQNQADLKNSVIKLITGAQMGQQEAERILGQVPTENDRPEIWKAKFEQTKQNVTFLEGMIQRQTGQTGQPKAEATGRIRVRNKKTGQTGTISAGAFDPAKYDKL